MQEDDAPKFNGRSFEDGVPKPKDIVEHLNDYVIGQMMAKKVLSVAMHNHYKRLHHAGKGETEI